MVVRLSTMVGIHVILGRLNAVGSTAGKGRRGGGRGGGGMIRNKGQGKQKRFYHSSSSPRTSSSGPFLDLNKLTRSYSSKSVREYLA